MPRNLSVFVVKHWGVAGEGTGVSFVVARAEQQARLFTLMYLQQKPEGYRQFSSSHSFEVEPYQDSSYGRIPLKAHRGGVVSEIHYPPDTEDANLVFVRDHELLADRLDGLQQKLNQGRGADCVRTLVMFLRSLQFNSARACVLNEWDKISGYPAITGVLEEVGFCPAPFACG